MSIKLPSIVRTEFKSKRLPTIPEIPTRSNLDIELGTPLSKSIIRDPRRKYITRSSSGSSTSTSTTTLPRLTESKKPNLYPAKFTGNIDSKVFKYDTVVISNPTILNCTKGRKIYYKSTMDEVLGKGTWGKIIIGCDDNNCNYAIKIIDLYNNPDDIDIAMRDTYYLNLLQDVKLNNQYIVPRLLDYFMCYKSYTFYISMEKFDTNMRNYGIEQYKEHFDDIDTIPINKSQGLLFKDTELVRMFQIAQLLTIYGIIDYDINPRQYLYRYSDGLITITDFGYAGDIIKPSVEEISKIYWKPEIGWISTAPYLCGTSSYKAALNPLDSHDIRIHLNTWQLNTWLMNIDDTWVIDTREPISRIVKFGGFRFPREFIEYMNAFCPHNSSLRTEILEDVSSFILDLKTIGLSTTFGKS